MKVIELVTVVALIIPVGLVLAQSGDMIGMDMKSTPADKKAQAATYKAVGVVKKIDSAKGTVTLAHGAVKELKWPAMTMDFAVKDKQRLAKLKPGQKVEFKMIEQPKGQYLITEIEPKK